jgi:hypothetical protein
MKRLSLACLLLGFSVLSIRAVEEKVLIVEQQNGGISSFLLSERPEMKFENHVLQIDMKGKTTDFEIDQVRQFYFDSASSDISHLPSTGLRIYSTSDDKVVIEGIDEKESISLCSLKGTNYANRVSTNNRVAEISLAHLPKGTYLISVSNKTTFKIIKK